MVVLETANLNEIEFSEYCRNKGIYPEQVKEWKEACMNANDGEKEQNAKVGKELKEERRQKEKRIEAQDYPYQSLLPSENTLIEEYNCSRNTVRRAIAELIADGYVQAMQGRGVRVIYQPVGKTTFTIGGIETFQETARRNHLQAVTRVIRFETITATEQFAAESGFSEGDELWAVQRVRYLDGKALILDINYFLKEFVPGLTEEIASHSIYDFIENVLGMQIITSKRRITVEHATVRDEKLLDMDGYDCVAVVVNQTFNSDGLLFEYTQSRHQPDYFCFQDIATRKKS
jgi:GntR family trehalose operon transcriptional repressor